MEFKMNFNRKLIQSKLRTNRITHLVLFIALLLVSVNSLYAAWGTVREVDGAKRTLITVNEKNRAYWQVEKGSAASIEITGPAVLRVISRTPWKSKYRKNKQVFSWQIDSNAATTVNHSLRKSKAARLKDGRARVSASRSDEIIIPPGTHKISFNVLGNTSNKIFLRFKRKFVHPIPSGSNIDKLVIGECESRDVIVGETKTRYNVLQSGKKCSVEVIGPTFLKVISRLDWNPTLSGKQRYMLRIIEDGALKNTYVLNGVRSDVAAYGGKIDSVPSKGEVIYVEVPAGKHTYEVEFKDSGREVNLRFLIPRESLRNSE
jgi:hypothetical protein